MTRVKNGRKGKVSNGERRSSMSTKNKDAGIRLLNQMAALRKGKDVIFSIENIDKDGKVHPNKRVKVSGKEYLAKMKRNTIAMKDAEQG